MPTRSAKFSFIVRVTTVLVALFLVVSSALAEVQYELIKIPNVAGGSNVTPFDISDGGQVVGRHCYGLATTYYYPFTWRQGDAAVTSLGRYDLQGNGNGEGTAVSEEGRVVGWTNSAFNNNIAFW